MINKRDKLFLVENIYPNAKLEYETTKITLRNVCAKYHIERGTFSKFLKLNNTLTVKKVDSNINKFDIIDTEEKAYWLGFLYADGCVRYNDIPPTTYTLDLCLQERDIGHIEKFKVFMESERPITYREKVKAHRILISNKHLAKRLSDLGCFQNKSLTLKFPTEQQVPTYLHKHFIRGYFDGDGCIGKSRNTFDSSILGTSEFLTKLLEILDFKDLKIIKKDKRHLNNTYFIQFRMKETIYFLNYLYQDANIYLDRKYDRYLQFLKSREIIDTKKKTKSKE